MDERARAIDRLKLVIGVDPLYQPARFFLGYARLLDGDAEQAQALFKSLIAPVDAEAEVRLRSIQHQWSVTGPRWRHVIRHVRPLQRIMAPWLAMWRDVNTHLVGGTLLWLSNQWSTFDQQIAAWRAAPPADRTAGPLMRLYIQSFNAIPDIRKLVEIAAGMTVGDVTADVARARLDRLFNRDDIRRFDHELSMLEIDLIPLKSHAHLKPMLDSLGIPSDEPAREDKLPAIRSLSTLGAISGFLEDELSRLETLWSAKQWDDCEKQIKELRDWSREASDYQANLLLRALTLPRHTGWLIRFFMPVYGLLDPWRAAVRYAFYLESRYYSAVAEFSTLTPEALESARMKALDLHESVLAPPVPADMDPRRHAELRLLCQCLEADAAVRLVLAESSETRDARARFLEISKTLPAQLQRASLTADPPVRAAALTTLGLLERCQQRSLHADKREPGAGLSLFLRALDVRPSADTCFYVAECLLEREQRDEAGRYLDQALALCPRHAGALSLRAGGAANALTGA